MELPWQLLVGAGLPANRVFPDITVFVRGQARSYACGLKFMGQQ